MTVKELIEKLQEFDGELTIVYDTYDVGMANILNIEIQNFYNYCDLLNPLTDKPVVCLG